MYYLDWQKFDVFNNAYYIEEENVALFLDIVRSRLGGHGKVMENF